MKKNCLLILPRSIFPKIGGYAIKNQALVKILHETYNLTLIVISENTPSEEEIDFYQSHSVEYKVFTYPKYRFYLNAFRSLFSATPLQVGYFYFNNVQSYVDEILPEQDVVIGALIRAMKYLSNAKSQIKVFDMVDSIALNYKRSKANVKSLFWKLIYKVETNRLFDVEKRYIETSDITYLFNWKETEYWKKYGNVHLLPHGVNDKLFSYDNKDSKYENAVVFIGKMDYQPNVDAALWYLNNVHSKIGEDIPFYIVGASPSQKLIEESNKYKNVFVTGFVDDPFIYVKSAMVVVAPMQTGGGIQNKVLEAMGLGNVVITTTLSALPIYGAEDGKHLIIADTPSEFIESINKVKENKNLAKMIGEEARRFIINNYTWTAYGKKYTDLIDEILANKK